MSPVKRQISPHAAPLRRFATDAERLLWSRLRSRRLGCKFRFQHTLGPYITDFVCLERKLIIEADGGQHNAQADGARTAYLRKRGFSIIRFWNHDILRNIDVFRRLSSSSSKAAAIRAPEIPSPAFRGRGVFQPDIDCSAATVKPRAR